MAGIREPVENPYTLNSFNITATLKRKIYYILLHTIHKVAVITIDGYLWNGFNTSMQYRDPPIFLRVSGLTVLMKTKPIYSYISIRLHWAREWMHCAMKWMQACFLFKV